MSTDDPFEARPLDDSEQYIEVWNDLVSPRHLTWSLVGCAGATAAALLIATALSSSLFLWGLGGSVVGFIICAVVITPKRVVQITAIDDIAEPDPSASELVAPAVAGDAR